jgi:hypothetical protein
MPEVLLIPADPELETETVPTGGEDCYTEARRLLDAQVATLLHIDPRADSRDDSQVVMFLDEDGGLLGLPRNPRATVFAPQIPWPLVALGPAVMMRVKVVYDNEDEADLVIEDLTTDDARWINYCLARASARAN